MIITVREQDIESGVPLDPFNCPIACAIRRQTGTRCVVTGLAIENPEGNRIDAPQVVSAFVDRFDNAWGCRPFSFELPNDFLATPATLEVEPCGST